VDTQALTTPLNTTQLPADHPFLACCPAAVRAVASPRLSRRCLRVRASSSSEDIGTGGLVAAAAGAVANPVMLYSEYVLKTTGSGLPPGPGGLYGAIGGWQVGGSRLQ
jgi:hypothetical protein